MKNNSRIRFNPGTKEIEVEGSESFVKTYFDKLQAMLGGSAEETGKVKKAPKAIKAAPAKKAEKKPKAAKAPKAAKKKPGTKRVTNIDVILGLIQESAEGISTTELKTKTGFAESKIWNIIARATKQGKIRKLKRGVYGAAG